MHVPWGFNLRRGNPQPLWLTGSSWWEGWGSAWSHRIEANPFWFAEDSIYRWHQCLWSFCLEAWQHLPSWLLVKTFATALELVKGIFYQRGAIHNIYIYIHIYRYIYIYIYIYKYIDNIFYILSKYPTQKKTICTTIEWWCFVLTGTSTNRRVNGWRH